VAGAALLMDYILTVSVSISSGVAQITSAFPGLWAWRVVLGVLLVGFVMFGNLRGVKESGLVFATPTYFFVGMMYLTVGTALFRHLTGSLHPLADPPPLEIETTRAFSLFLLLHAFSSGTTAVTGVEAISNGIPAFKKPRSHNAGVTLMWMSGILGSLFLGISYLAGPIGAVPSERETLISQLARAAFEGRGLLYLAAIAATTSILVMAANTAYSDFPRLAALQAADGYLPRPLTYRGSRLVYSRGIVVLALVASFLIVVFQASVTGLIPLYAIGVFLSFTLSQTGMALRWRKSGCFLQDLTLEYGLRVSKMTNNIERNGRGARFDATRYDPSQGAYRDDSKTYMNGVAYAKLGEVSKNLIPSRPLHFMPRLNFVYDIRGNGDLIVRGGAGLFYNRPMGNAEYDVLSYSRRTPTASRWTPTRPRTSPGGGWTTTASARRTRSPSWAASTFRDPCPWSRSSTPATSRRAFRSVNGCPCSSAAAGSCSSGWGRSTPSTRPTRPTTSGSTTST
jgi:hypothetical protein